MQPKPKLNFSFHFLPVIMSVGALYFSISLTCQGLSLQDNDRLQTAETFCISHWWDAGQLERCLLVSILLTHSGHIQCFLLRETHDLFSVAVLIDKMVSLLQQTVGFLLLILASAV